MLCILAIENQVFKIVLEKGRHTKVLSVLIKLFKNDLTKKLRLSIPSKGLSGISIYTRKEVPCARGNIY